MSAGEKLCPPILVAEGGGELPGGRAGSRTRPGLKIKNPCFTPKLRADGSGVIVLHHGGNNLEFEITNAERLTLLGALGGTDDFNGQPTKEEDNHGT